MFYIYKVDNHFVYVKCNQCGQEAKLFPFSRDKDIIDYGDYYEGKYPIMACNHMMEYPNRVYKRNPAITDTPTVSCPHCGSTQIQLVNRGWNVATGLIGSGKVKRYCVNCMKEF
jgi:endogenous inhibitor of DNA gyrase (YacG/DUF329 family)